MIQPQEIRHTLIDNPGNIKTLPMRTVTLYQAGENNWRFCHHAEVGVFKGEIYTMWSNSPTGEDECGQRTLFCKSSDGEHFSAPRVLCENLPGKEYPAVLTAAGWLDRKDSLAAYFAAYEYASPAERTDRNGVKRFGSDICRTRLYCMTSEDGEKFTPPADLQVPLCPNIGPQRLHSGRLLITGNWAHAYTDDPRGEAAWRMAGFADPAQLPTPVADDPDYFWRVSKILNMPGGMCEGAFYQTDDHVLHMLHRSHTDWLYESHSLDEGESWSLPAKTNFPNCRSKVQFGRLPDGRFYYIGNPLPGTGRNPLVLSVSKDGALFDTHYLLAGPPCERKYQGYAKNGMYAYPHSVIAGDMLYIVYTVWKEDVRFVAIPLNNL